MNKKQARAILAFKRKIEKACNELMPQLEGSHEYEFANGYYVAHILRSVSGWDNGSAPIGQAETLLGID